MREGRGTPLREVSHLERPLPVQRGEGRQQRLHALPQGVAWRTQQPTRIIRADSPGNKCISCHMPMTSFARMNRSDHSMLPPTPSATIAYKSPNACNLCHTDKDAAWADKYVREWRTPRLPGTGAQTASLIDAARKRDWSKLPEMLDYITGKDRDEVFAIIAYPYDPGLRRPEDRSCALQGHQGPLPLVVRLRADALRTCLPRRLLKLSWKRPGMTTASSGSGPRHLFSLPEPSSGGSGESKKSRWQWST